MSERKVNDLPTGFPMSDYEHWMLEHAKDTPWTESGGKAIIRDLVDLADRATDTAIDLARRLAAAEKTAAQLQEQLACRDERIAGLEAVMAEVHAAVTPEPGFRISKVEGFDAVKKILAARPQQPSGEVGK